MCISWVYAFHIGYQCLSLTSGKLYIRHDVIFKEHDYPYKEQPLIYNLDTQSTLGLLGSSPAPIPFVQTPRLVSPSIESTPIVSTSQSSPMSTDSIHEPSYSPLLPDSPNQGSVSSSNVSPKNVEHSKPSVTGHYPSTNPLSPLNLDSHSSSSFVKTRRLSNILHTVDSAKTTQSTKFPLPTCFHTSSYLPPKPATFTSASKQLEWIAPMQDEFNALIQNQTWQLVPRSPNRLVISCKWAYKTKPFSDSTLIIFIFNLNSYLI